MPQFEEKLNAILSDENAMGQIMALAQSLSGNGQDGDGRGEEDAPPIQLPDCGRDVRLLEALRPYLRADRQKKIDRMLDVLQMLRLLKKANHLPPP